MYISSNNAAVALDLLADIIDLKQIGIEAALVNVFGHSFAQDIKEPF